MLNPGDWCHRLSVEWDEGGGVQVTRFQFDGPDQIRFVLCVESLRRELSREGKMN